VSSASLDKTQSMAITLIGAKITFFTVFDVMQKTPKEK
jgi:hypothetical protein